MPVAVTVYEHDVRTFPPRFDKCGAGPAEGRLHFDRLARLRSRQRRSQSCSANNANHVSALSSRSSVVSRRPFGPSSERTSQPLVIMVAGQHQPGHRCPRGGVRTAAHDGSGQQRVCRSRVHCPRPKPAYPLRACQDPGVQHRETAGQTGRAGKHPCRPGSRALPLGRDAETLPPAANSVAGSSGGLPKSQIGRPAPSPLPGAESSGSGDFSPGPWTAVQDKAVPVR